MRRLGDILCGRGSSSRVYGVGLSARRDQSTVLWGKLDAEKERTPMSFHTRAGSRGGRKMRVGPVSRWIMQQLTNRARRKGGRFLGMDVLVLSTVGRKTGQPRQATVSWFPDGENAWLIVASAGGSAHNPDWYHNLAAHPDQVSIEQARGRRATPANEILVETTDLIVRAGRG
jgi:deazaflavin-dependent oxidoreductase (nitroreductase family)